VETSQTGRAVGASEAPATFAVENGEVRRFLARGSDGSVTRLPAQSSHDPGHAGNIPSQSRARRATTILFFQILCHPKSVKKVIRFCSVCVAHAYLELLSLNWTSIMPRRKNDESKKASEGNKVFGALGGSSQRSHRSLKEVFGDISTGTSKVLRSIREQFVSSNSEGSDSSNTSRASKASRKSDKKTSDVGSKHSKTSKLDKSHMSKKRGGGLRSGIVRDGRSQAGHRGKTKPTTTKSPSL
jgi:hypothetical protein